MKKITAAPRPFLLTFRASGHTYPITSEECQNLLDAYPAVTATATRVVLVGHNTADPSARSVLTPATRGGGPAFTLEGCRHEWTELPGEPAADICISCGARVY